MFRELLQGIHEMRTAGLSKWEMVGEFLAALCVILLPILMLFVGHALGLD